MKVKLILLFGLSACAYSGPLLITSGSFVLNSNAIWAFVGDGFSASGSQDFGSPVDHCGLCLAPFQLISPLHAPFFSANGLLTLGAKSYILPGASFNGGSPFALGSIFLSPQGTLPTVQGAGTFDVPFSVGGSFCVTDDPSVPPPFPPNPGDPACFSVLGAAVGHYTVSATAIANAFFQPIPTFEIVPVPEPATLGAGTLAMLLMLAAKVRSRVRTS